MTRTQTRTQSRIAAAPPAMRGRDREIGRRRGRDVPAAPVPQPSTGLIPELGVAFEAAPVAMAVVSAAGLIERINPAMERLMRRPAGEVQGQEIAQVLRGADGADGAEGGVAGGPVQAVIRGRERGASFECDMSIGGGGVVAARVTATGLRPGAGALLVIENVSAQRASERRAAELEAQLRHASRLSLAGELSASLAHEMTQPMAAVANYTQAALLRMSRTGECTEEVLSHLRSADAEARRGGRMVRNLAMFVRSRACERAEADLADVVGEIGGMIRAAAGGARAGVEVSAGPGLTVMVDRVQIQQVILNLVKNGAESAAAAAGGTGGTGGAAEPVRVRAWSPEPGVAEVSVRDAGCGLSAEAAARVFSPFFTTKAQGMGLGLSICRSIIEAHGGELSGHNNPPPAPGATFRFRLPLFINSGDKSYDG